MFASRELQSEKTVKLFCIFLLCVFFFWSLSVNGRRRVTMLFEFRFFFSGERERVA